MGHRRAGAFPVSRRRILPRRRLLRTGLRREQLEVLRDFGQLARRISDPSESSRPREFPLCRSWQ